MKVLVWGLGPVGTVTAACFAWRGHHVTAVEQDTRKVAALNNGRSPVALLRIGGFLPEVVRLGRLKAVADGRSLVGQADMSLICVGTPSDRSGRLSLDSVREVGSAIAQGLRGSGPFHAVVLRSTVFPGTTRNHLLPILRRQSGKRSGQRFGVVANPEFLRSDSAVDDFLSPPYVVIGLGDRRAGRMLEGVYSGFGFSTVRVSLEDAEMLKLTSNAFHSLKVAFANEISRLCSRVGSDGEEVMRLVCRDRKLNISAAYMRPGASFGGRCLPKDLTALTSGALALGAEVPLLKGILSSNRVQAAVTVAAASKSERSERSVAG